MREGVHPMTPSLGAGGFNSTFHTRSNICFVLVDRRIGLLPERSTPCPISSGKWRAKRRAMPDTGPEPHWRCGELRFPTFRRWADGQPRAGICPKLVC